MKGWIGAIGCVAAAAVSGTVVYLYLNDREVRAKVNAAVESVRDAVDEIGLRVSTLHKGTTVSYQQADDQNRAWVEQQWEALGI
jgi:hypothetical protein